ncbi:hypothetical protein O5559_28680, partial [Escherichia coli]|nr:hypothetical protein [Escherichia coli]
MLKVEMLSTGVFAEWEPVFDRPSGWVLKRTQRVRNTFQRIADARGAHYFSTSVVHRDCPRSYG